MYYELDSKRQEMNTEAAKLNAEATQMVLVDKPDYGKIEKKLKKAADIKAELHMLHLKHMTEIRTMLNDGQRAAFDEKMKEGFGRRH